ncbi:MAG: biotin--[acetyl-CoA-carboxylase] ligase [Dethiobacteria bacterium]
MNKTGKIFAGKNIYYYPTVDSTNQAMHRLAKEGVPTYSIALAEEQLEGRGRLGRSWFSPPGSGLWFSMLIRPMMLTPAGASPLTLVTAAVMAAHLNDHYNLPVKVKWPNDLLIDGKKAGGILTELKGDPDRVEYLIVGIGLNVNQQLNDFPAELDRQSTSLYIASGLKINRLDLFLSLRDELLNAYPLFLKEGFTPFRDLWKENNTTLGQEVTLNWDGGKLEGKALDLTETGALLISDKDGQIHIINYGEIS